MPKPCIYCHKTQQDLRTQEKFRKHEPQACVFYISQVFSNLVVFYDSVIQSTLALQTPRRKDVLVVLPTGFL